MQPRSFIAARLAIGINDDIRSTGQAFLITDGEFQKQVKAWVCKYLWLCVVAWLDGN